MVLRDFPSRSLVAMRAKTFLIAGCLILQLLPPTAFVQSAEFAAGIDLGIRGAPTINASRISAGCSAIDIQAPSENTNSGGMGLNPEGQTGSRVQTTVVDATSGVCTNNHASRPSAESEPTLSPAQSSTEHRYVLFLDGITSHSSLVEPFVQQKFSQIEQHLRDSVGISNYVYFSYGAAAGMENGDLYCGGWGPASCSETSLGELSSLSLTPVYNREDTTLSVDLQAEALDWLLGQVVLHDPQAQIDLIGFSLGGIIASRWAAELQSDSELVDHVGSIIIIESPVGGVYGAQAILDVRLEGAAWQVVLRSVFGSEVLRNLQMPGEGVSGTIVHTLEQAAERFNFVSIQSTHDFLVNGEVLEITPELSGGRVPIGLGSQNWTAEHIAHHDFNLGGEDANTISFSRLRGFLIANHSAALNHPQTAQWISSALERFAPSHFPPAPTLQIVGPHGPNDIIDIIIENETYDLTEGTATADVSIQANRRIPYHISFESVGATAPSYEYLDNIGFLPLIPSHTYALGRLTFRLGDELIIRQDKWGYNWQDKLGMLVYDLAVSYLRWIGV